MSYQRAIKRNRLDGEYGSTSGPMDQASRSLIAGDLRRVEHDQRDPWFLAAYEQVTGVPAESVKAVLDAFFERHDEIERARVKTSWEEREAADPAK